MTSGTLGTLTPYKRGRLGDFGSGRNILGLGKTIPQNSIKKWVV
jgi:hypothetical protein